MYATGARIYYLDEDGKTRCTRRSRNTARDHCLTLFTPFSSSLMPLVAPITTTKAPCRFDGSLLGAQPHAVSVSVVRPDDAHCPHPLTDSRLTVQHLH